MKMRMLASRSVPTLLCGIVLCVPALGVEEQAPDLAFLEYLGMWEESDEDWLLVDEETMAENDKRNDSEPKGEESAENHDEG